MQRRICQNIDILLIKLKISKSVAASHFQEDLMADFWSSFQLTEHFYMLWTSTLTAWRIDYIIKWINFKQDK